MASWCYRREYEEEREREKASCVFVALESDREDPLFVSRHEPPSSEGPAKEEAKGVAPSPAATADESADTAGREANAVADASTKTNARGRSASQLARRPAPRFPPRSCGRSRASSAAGPLDPWCECRRSWEQFRPAEE